MKKDYFVYIVECSDNSYYIGVTNHLERRLDEHNSGLNKKSYTYKRRPVTLKYSSVFYDIKQAITFEKQKKGWNKKKKKALFEENWKEIVRLASIRYGQEPPSSSSG